MRLSKRAKNMQTSSVRKLVKYEKKAKASGHKIYHLNIGQPDLNVPKEFMEAIQQYDNETLGYAPSQGLPVLIDKISRYYTSLGMNFHVDEIFITNGGSEAILFALMATCDKGDQILVPEPFYSNYTSIAQMADVRIIPVTTKSENGFHLPSQVEIEACITPEIKTIMLSNPSNPTGVVYTEAEIEMIADIAEKHNLWIIADEVYREFIYDGFQTKSFGKIERIAQRTIIVDSISKRYSACGARVGSLISKNTELNKQFLKLCQSRLCISTMDQLGASGLYELAYDYFHQVNREYTNRRNTMCNGLNEIPGVSCQTPEGAFYVVAKLPVEDTNDFSKWLLQEFTLNGETVMLTPAAGFYATPGLGHDEVRIAYVLNEQDIKKSLYILAQGLEKYCETL